MDQNVDIHCSLELLVSGGSLIDHFQLSLDMSVLHDEFQVFGLVDTLLELKEDCWGFVNNYKDYVSDDHLLEVRNLHDSKL